jgi:hypothetical protein
MWHVGCADHVTVERHLKKALDLEDRRRKVYERLTRACVVPPVAAWPISRRRRKAG